MTATFDDLVSDADCVVPGACGAAAGAGLYAEAAGGGKTHLVTSAQ